MTSSSKSTVAPATKAGERIAKHLQSLGIAMKCEKLGADIGVDTSSTNIRTTVKQQERLDAGAKKARRCNALAKMNAAVRRAAITGVKPTQEYASIAVGMALTSIKKPRAMLQMPQGSCRQARVHPPS